MEWGEFRTLYAQKRREALAVTQGARAIRNSQERSTAQWRAWFWPFSLCRRRVSLRSKRGGPITPAVEFPRSSPVRAP